MSQQDKKIKNRPTKIQVCKLITYMEAHKAFALSEVDDVVSAIAWQQLTPELNANGFARDTQTWQKTWADLQRMAEQRMLALNLGTRAMPLSDEDIRVLKIKQHEPADSKRGFSRSRSPLDDYTSEEVSRTEFIKSVKVDEKCKSSLQTSTNAPTTIDLTNDLDRRSATRGRRASTVLSAPTTPSIRQAFASVSGSNTSAMMNIFKEHSAEMKTTLNNIIDCFERQNIILKQGFKSIATKLDVQDNPYHSVSPKAEMDFDFKSGATYSINIANINNDGEQYEELCFEDVELAEEYVEDDHDRE